MVKPLPSRFNPDLMARDGTRYEVELPFDRLPRLKDMLYLGGAHGEGSLVAAISAVFSRRKDHIVVSGRLRVSYPLQCQRCLEPMRVDLDEPYELVFVESQRAADRLPKELDPVVLDENGQIHVVDLYEDELMLHVPTIPKHTDSHDCAPGTLQFGGSAIENETPEDEPGRPFDVLKNLNIH